MIATIYFSYFCSTNRYTEYAIALRELGLLYKAINNSQRVARISGYIYMLRGSLTLLERDGGYIAINPKFDKLITSLRTSVENDGVLDKEATSYDDIFDAFRLAMHFYKLSEYQHG
jgi:hypothetical protein